IDYQRGVLLARQAELRGSSSSKSTEMRESEDAYLKAIKGQKSLVEESRAQVQGGTKAGRDSGQQRTALGRFRDNLGKLLGADKRFDEAEAEFRAVLELLTDSEKLAGARWQRARAAHNLGQLSLKPRAGLAAPDQKSRAARGRELIHVAKDLLEALRQEFPEVP